MKKIATLLFVFVLAFAIGTSSVSAAPAAQCDPADPLCITTEIPTEGFVVPRELVILLAAGVTYLVTNGLKSTGLEFGGATSRIIAGSVFSLVTFANELLAMVPIDAQPAVKGGFILIIGILSAYGIHFSTKKPKPESISEEGALVDLDEEPDEDLLE
jgi:hypothetical protein